MGIETESVMAKSFGGGGGWGGVMAKSCDSCKTASASIYCKHDSAFLCLNCDTKIHKLTTTSRHQRVWMCQVCEQAPAVVTCKADAAALCVTCDADIHSANPLARRHERIPVEPFFDSAESMIKSSSVFNFISHHTHEEEVASWLLPNPSHLIGSKLVDDAEIKPPGHDLNTNLFFTDMDSFLDFDYPNPVHDSVVPVQTKPIATENCYDIDFCKSKLNSFAYQYQPQSLSHSVSSSSLDVGVVPEGNSMSEISYPFNQTVPDSSLPVCASASPATQLCGIDREARVLRYREKRKNRKFEKTIRYASRKAYAETRPRIKGRFAKRTEILNDVDDIYGSANSPAFLVDAYGVVPTF